jgi:hemimethylated DNA binding protein
VLVHGQGNETYVAESNLTSDQNIDPVDHPFVDIFFYEYDNSGSYSLKQTFN